jgi:hypothetical protein
MTIPTITEQAQRCDEALNAAWSFLRDYVEGEADLDGALATLWAVARALEDAEVPGRAEPALVMDLRLAIDAHPPRPSAAGYLSSLSGLLSGRMLFDATTVIGRVSAVSMPEAGPGSDSATFDLRLAVNAHANQDLRPTADYVVALGFLTGHMLSDFDGRPLGRITTVAVGDRVRRVA